MEKPIDTPDIYIMQLLEHVHIRLSNLEQHAPNIQDREEGQRLLNELKASIAKYTY